MENQNKKTRSARGEKKRNVLDTILSIIRALPGFIIFGYAYIYIIGYFYLHSYFSFWGLSTLELGFSIVDYATLALLPLFILAFIIYLSSLAGLAIYYIFSDKTKYEKISRKKFQAPLIFAITLTLVTIFITSKNDMFYGLILLIYVFLGNQIGLIVGRYYFVDRYSKKDKSWKYIYIYATILILLIPIVSTFFGSENAKIYSSYYTISPFKALGLNKVKFISNNPINELETFQKGTNMYDGLMLLVHKNETYFFVVDITECDKVNLALDKKIEDNRISLRIINSEILRLKRRKRTLSSKEQEYFNDILKRYELLKSQSRELSNLYEDFLDSFKKTYAIREEQLSSIIFYPTKKTRSEFVSAREEIEKLKARKSRLNQ